MLNSTVASLLCLFFSLRKYLENRALKYTFTIKISARNRYRLINDWGGFRIHSYIYFFFKKIFGKSIIIKILIFIIKFSSRKEMQTDK